MTGNLKCTENTEVGKILAQVKTLQQRLQKSRSYNTNKELMENDSNRKSFEKGGGGGGRRWTTSSTHLAQLVNPSLGGSNCRLDRRTLFLPAASTQANDCGAEKSERHSAA